jgi:hypothetical protein
MSWAMQSARMAQIRRDPASEVASVFPRRDFRPTGSWARFALSPTRPLAVSPILPGYLQIRPRSQVAGGWIIAFDPHLFQEPFALDFLT